VIRFFDLTLDSTSDENSFIYLFIITNSRQTLFYYCYCHRMAFLYTHKFLQNSISFQNIFLNPKSLNYRYLSAQISDIDAKKLVILKTKNPKPKPKSETLVFGRNFTDHMIQIKWNKTQGWATPEIVPYAPLSLEPSALVFHYAIECFEGMKAYVDKNNKTRLFRPLKNMDRLNKSAARLLLPTFNGEQLLDCIKQFVKLEKEWIPKLKGYSLYIRPTMIATQSVLGVGPTSDALLYVIASPVGPYYPEGFNPVKLYAETKYVRAWPGGTGGNKLGLNYAPTILPQVEANKKGYTQVLWLVGPNHEITEVGTMNLFVYWKNEKGENELVTAPLDDGTILPGVTRDSVIALAKQMKNIKVSERTIHMKDLLKSIQENRLLEVFGAGTAAVISPVKAIFYNGKEYAIPLDKANPSANAGPLAASFYDKIIGIQYGEIESDWSLKID